MKTKLLTATLLIPILLSGMALAEDLTDVEEIVRQANLAAFYAGADGRAEARMTIVDGQGRKQVRQFTILRQDVADGEDQNFLVLFSYPADVRDTVFMVKKHVGGNDDRWLYLPGLDLVKRIAAGDKRTSFVGSHFLYEDVSGRSLAEDEHTLTETTETHYVVRNVPKDPQSVEFSEYTVWIDKSNMMPVRTEYKDASGEIYRRIEALAIEVIDGHPTATKMQASDLKRNAHTITETRHIKYDNGIPEKIFTERSLRNPPRQWLKR
jgi:outer membrane lipoprotein-sorting protein